MSGNFLPRLLNLSSFRSPLLRVIVPSVTAAVAIQAACAVPSIINQSDRFYDFSGSLTYIAVGALSLYLPVLRARAAAAAAEGVAGASVAASKAHTAFPSLFAPFGAGSASAAAWNWRQVLLTGAMTVWAVRLGSYLFQRILREGRDARFDEIKKQPTRFAASFFAQSMWVSLCLMPIMAINAVPSAALAALPRITATDVLGLSMWLGGFAFEIAADRQKNKWLNEKRAKQHDEQFLTKGLFGVCRFPNYFGEMTLWTGLATAAAGTLARKPVQLALGFTSPAGILATTTLCALSPAFTIFILTKLSGIPLSEKKYDKKYGDRKDYQEWKNNTPRLIPKLW